MSEDSLLPQDRQLLGRIAAGNDWWRSVLCTLARHGTRLRRDEPARAEQLIAALSPWPWFKAGQFLFDLLEWEDFMVDGPPPPALPTVLQPENWQRLDDLLGAVRALVDAAQPGPERATAGDDAAGGGAASAGPLRMSLPVSVSAMVARFGSDDELPPLEPGLHLYRDVVLGVWDTAATTAPDPAPGP